MSQATEAVIAELMDRRMLNDVDDDLHQEIAEAVIKAAATKAETAPAAVKPLVWRDHRPDSFPEPAWSAQTPFGFYNIEEISASDSPAYVVRLHAHHFIADKDSLDDAKAAAQADYERRIRSALVSPTSAPASVAAMKEACKQVALGYARDAAERIEQNNEYYKRSGARDTGANDCCRSTKYTAESIAADIDKIDVAASAPSDAVRVNDLAKAIRDACEKCGYDLKLREFSPRTEIGIRNFIERSEYIAAALTASEGNAAPGQQTDAVTVEALARAMVETVYPASVAERWFERAALDDVADLGSIRRATVTLSGEYARALLERYDVRRR